MSQQPKRRKNSLRLSDYDYSQSGGYFVTICTNKKVQILSDIVDGEVMLSKIGEIVNDCWLAIPNHFENVELGHFVIMPNHIHGILLLYDILEDSTDNQESSVGARYISPHSCQVKEIGCYAIHEFPKHESKTSYANRNGYSQSHARGINTARR